MLSARRGQCGQRHSIGRVLYVERLTAGSMTTPSFFVICQVSRFVRPVGLQIFQGEESFHSAGRENGQSVMRNGLYIIRNNAHESSDCWMSIQRLSCFFNLCFSCSGRSNKRRRDYLLPPLVARCDAAQASPAHPTPSAGLAARNQLPPYYAKKMIPPTDIWGAPVGRLTCGPTKLTRTQGLST